ncbi:uncharacterized protein LOC143275905 [Babylonia areolata]|uniref:uncharacterized protein LOC143275905 n=1 Tax=Babylonia areolata TaxID=304850 RepID=UPI003FD65C63
MPYLWTQQTQECSGTENALSEELQTAQKNAEKLSKMEDQIETAIQNREACKIVLCAQDMRTGSGRQEYVDKMEVKPLQSVCRPVHLADVPKDDAMFVSMRNFIGKARQVTYDRVQPEVKVREEAQCGDHDDSVVFSLCPADTVTRVSFVPSYKEKGPCEKKFSAVNGEVTAVSERKGPHSYRNRTGDKRIVLPYLSNPLRDTFVKCSAVDTHHRLTTSTHSNIGDVFHVQVVKEEPFETKSTELFTISCSVHRAVDVDSSQQLFAVVEEPSSADKTRQVKLFRRRQRDAIDRYRSPLTPWQPADVCFFTLGGQEVLLIADELNDAIHVVKVKDDRLTFSRFLAPGCPVLIQPTALNADRQGRLWVGCRGGRLLTMKALPHPAAGSTAFAAAYTASTATSSVGSAASTAASSDGSTADTTVASTANTQ